MVGSSSSFIACEIERYLVLINITDEGLGQIK